MRLQFQERADCWIIQREVKDKAKPMPEEAAELRKAIKLPQDNK